MNVQRLTRLRRLIAEVLKDEQLDMAHYGTPSRLAKHECNSAGCIAGWALTIFSPSAEGKSRYDDVHDDAQEVLELTDKQAEYLFCPELGFELCRVTRLDAVQAIDGLIETGMPTWPEWMMESLALASFFGEEGE